MSEVEAPVVESARQVVSVVTDSIRGHARHAAALVSRDPADPLDPARELNRFVGRSLNDGLAFARAMWLVVEALAFEPIGKIPVPTNETPPTSNPITTTVGPVASGRCLPNDLRRRGEPSPTIPARLITVTRSATDASQIVLVIEAGGAPRGLYEGTVSVGSATNATPVTYNVYVDW